MRHFGALSSKWHVFLKPLPWRLRGLFRRGVGKRVWIQRWWLNPEMTSEKQHFPDRRGLVHTWTHTGCMAYTKPSQIQSKQILAWRRVSGYKIPSLTKQLWERKLDFFRGMSMGLSTTLQERPHAQEQWPNTNQTPHFVFGFVFVLSFLKIEEDDEVKWV